ncbi:type II toxin-antitoxin system PemK/MazF family toxin [Pediococcus acidilactici]|uniref:type II toxin-antitoxin system PemK/MazF family toxin n=1 Tax=Pediococcus acidilactici TaxID=1254 RepID=UPI0020CFDB0F|nr:type II toxin-antitoxin system PemK/MazF family toxin [Pediococcus acidilactici]
MKLSQGDVIWIDLNPAKGTETKKRRPCLVVSNNHYNRYFNTVLVVQSVRQKNTGSRKSM